MDFIKDKKGQWAHPGKNTLIPDANGRITMDGVSQPLLGIDDEGNQEIMMPGGEYQFPGNDVYEIPLDKFQGPLRLGETGNKINKAYNTLFKPFVPTFSNIINKTPSLTKVDLGLKPKTYGEWQWGIDRYNIDNKGGIQIGSLLGENNLVKQTNKVGQVNIGTVLNFINKTGNKADKEVMTQAANDIIGQIAPPDGTDVNKIKIPFKDFEEKVQNNLISFTPKLIDKYAHVGIEDLGYNTPSEMSGTSAPTQEEYDLSVAEMKNIVNKTILWQNNSIGDPINDSHFGTDEFGPSYGHSRFFVDLRKKIFNILEIQSDELQRPLLTKLAKNEAFAIDAQEKLDKLIIELKSLPEWEPNPNSIVPAIEQTREYQSKIQGKIKNKEAELFAAGERNIEITNLLESRTPNVNAQVKNLEKNHVSRLFGETIQYAVSQGHSTVRFPHASTLATIEGFGQGGATLEEMLVVPWTQTNVAEFDKKIDLLNRAQTYGHTTVSKQYGPFVNVPAEVNSVYSMDNSPRVTHETANWTPKKIRKPRMDTYGGDTPAFRESLYKDGWTDAEINAYKLNIGHWKNQHISLGHDGAYTMSVRSEGFNSGPYDAQVEIPTETAKNLQAGMYHIQADGSWKYIGEFNNPETKTYVGKVREELYEQLPYEKKPFDIFDYGGKNFKTDRNEFLKDGVTVNPNYNKRALDEAGEPTKEIKWTSQQTILRKYSESEFQNILKKNFGKNFEYKEVRDEKGNIWYEFEVPENWQKGTVPIKAFKHGGEMLPQYQDKGEVKTGTTVNYDHVEKGIRHIESLYGVLMKNKESSASGLYGQLFNDIEYDGTRDEFILDQEYQKELFNKRYNGEVEGVPGLEINGVELYEEYKDQIDNFNLTPTQIAAISNMLGRQGTRNYLGNVLRDGMTLEEGVPSAYGPDKPSNKTPDEFIELFNDSLKKKKIGGEIRDGIISDMLDKGAFLNKFKMGAEMQLKGSIGGYGIKKSYDETHRLPYIQFNSNDGEIVDNRIYYDKDDVDGTDNFNIIDIDSQVFQQDREHERVKQIIKKYDAQEKLLPVEENYLKELGLIETSELTKESFPMPVQQVSYSKDIKIEDINTQKDLNNKSDSNIDGISLMKQIEIYDAHINDIYRGNNKSIKVKKIYDKLNSLYYNDAKATSMTVFDYIKSLNN